MGVQSVDPTTGKPTFNDTSTTQADFQAAADFTALNGNTRRGTTAQMNAWTSAADGFFFNNTDDGWTYKRVSGAWTRFLGPAVACRLTKTTAQQTGNSAFGFATLSFDVEDYDPLDMHPASNPTRITGPVNGIYLAKAQFTGNTSGVGYGIKFSKNGADIEGTQVWDAGLGANGLASPTVTDIFQLAGGDYLEVRAACATASQNIATSASVRASFAVTLIQAL